MPALASRTRAAMPAAAKSPACDSTAASASSSAPRSSRARPSATAMSARRGSSSAASRSESSSPAASSSSAREGSSVEELLDFRRRHGADELVDDLAVAEGLDRRDPLHAVASAERLVGVDVDLGQQHPAAAAGLRRFQRRAQGFAGAAPLGPEVDHHRGLPRELDHVAIEGRFGYGDGHRGRLDGRGSGADLCGEGSGATVGAGRVKQRRRDVQR